MKTSKLVIIGMLLGAMLVLSGCATGGTLDRKLGGFTVAAFHGRSGVFVTNNVEDHTLKVSTSNGIYAEIRTGETAQLYTSGMLNGYLMLVTAKFYDMAGKYVGYDSETFVVNYYNGSPWVVEWDPYIRIARKLE